MRAANYFPNGPTGYEKHLDELGQELRWSRQNLRDQQAAGNDEAVKAWAKRVDAAQAAYDRAIRER